YPSHAKAASDPTRARYRHGRAGGPAPLAPRAEVPMTPAADDPCAPADELARRGRRRDADLWLADLLTRTPTLGPAWRRRGRPGAAARRRRRNANRPRIAGEATRPHRVPTGAVIGRPACAAAVLAVAVGHAWPTLLTFPLS